MAETSNPSQPGPSGVPATWWDARRWRLFDPLAQALPPQEFSNARELEVLLGVSQSETWPDCVYRACRWQDIAHRPFSTPVDGPPAIPHSVQGKRRVLRIQGHGSRPLRSPRCPRP